VFLVDVVVLDFGWGLDFCLVGALGGKERDVVLQWVDLPHVHHVVLYSM
jgi:hypothetical protein